MSWHRKRLPGESEAATGVLKPAFQKNITTPLLISSGFVQFLPSREDHTDVERAFHPAIERQASGAASQLTARARTKLTGCYLGERNTDTLLFYCRGRVSMLLLPSTGRQGWKAPSQRLQRPCWPQTAQAGAPCLPEAPRPRGAGWD